MNKFLIAILITICTIGFCTSFVSATSITVQSQSWTEDTCGAGEIQIVPVDKRAPKVIQAIYPGQTVNIDVQPYMKEIKFHSAGFGDQLN